MENNTTQHEQFVNRLLEYWDNIPLLKPKLARDLLRDIIDAAIKDIDAGNLTKESNIIDYIQWINDEILAEQNND